MDRARRSGMRRWLPLVAPVALAVSCAAPAGDRAEDPGRAEVAPSAGRQVYEDNCAMCHGQDGVAEAIAEGSPDLNDPEWQRSRTDEEIVEVIRAGRGMMPSWSGALSAEEIEQVTRYLRTLPAEPAESTP